MSIAVSYLLWNLPKITNKAQDGALLQWVIHIAQVQLVGIKVWVEGIDGVHRGRALLLVAEDQVYPQVEVCTHIVTL